MQFNLLRWNPARNRIVIISGSGFFWVLFTFALAISVIDGGKDDRLKRHAADDDELHDEEILRAVVTSLTEWQDRKRAKEARNNGTHLRVKRDEEVVCYGELGCFRDEGPFDYLDMLPSPPEEIASRFLLFTRQNRQIPQTFSYFNFTSMYNSHFNSSNPTKIIIHGFGSTCNRMWASEMRLALLAVVECNVICVDWENGAAMPNYVRAAVNTRLVGKQVAMFIKWLNDHLGSVTEDYHLVGFSLGAHVAGFAGQELKNLSRITGLDPAGPLFESYDPKVRLDTDDALFVDVIHSNGDSLLMGGLGSWEPMGHVDFYPNGGRVQKGCSNLFLGAVRDFLWSASEGDGRSLCNHRRAYKFFTESVSPRCPFPAFACESYDKFLAGTCFHWDAKHCGNMGYYADRLPNPKKGLLYLITREDEPFCANQFRIKVESSPSSAPVTTYGSLETILIGNDFINETFLVTQTVKDNMVAGSALQRIIVAHPALTDPVKIQLKYTAYQGWLYSGISRWSMERLILTNAYGQSMSFCSRGLMLPSGVAVTVTLSPGVCVNRFTNGPVKGVNGIVGAHPPMHNFNAPPGGIHEEMQHHGPPFHGFKPNTTAMPQEPTTGTAPSGPPAIHDSNSSEIDVLLKPPPMMHQERPAPQGPSAGDEVGPTYHLHQTELDWTEWHPVQKPVDIGRPDDINHNHHFVSSHNKLELGQLSGTTVEFYPPHVADMQPHYESNDHHPEIYEEVQAHDNKPVEFNVTADHSANRVNETTTEAIVNKTDLVKGSDRIGIRICHLTMEPARINASDGNGNHENIRKLTCVDTHNLTGLALNEMTHLVDLNDNLMKASEGLIINNEVRSTQNGVNEGDQKHEGAQSAPGNEILASIPVPPQSFWAAIRHNNTAGSETIQLKGADPDVVLPPHLQYILTQLDNQGFGPRATDIPQAALVKPGTSSNHFFPPRNVRQRRLFPYSRALKPRPVILGGRRQNRFFDVNDVHLTVRGPPSYPRSDNLGPVGGRQGHHIQSPDDSNINISPEGRGVSLARHDQLRPVPLALIGPALPVSSGRANPHPSMTRAMLAPIIYADGKFLGRMLPGPLSIPNMGMPNTGPGNRAGQHGFNSAGPKMPPPGNFQGKRMINGQEYIAGVIRDGRMMALPHGMHLNPGPQYPGNYKRKRVQLQMSPHGMDGNSLHRPPPPQNMHRWSKHQLGGMLDPMIQHVPVNMGRGRPMSLQGPHEIFPSTWIDSDDALRSIMIVDSSSNLDVREEAPGKPEQIQINHPQDVSGVSDDKNGDSDSSDGEAVNEGQPLDTGGDSGSDHTLSVTTTTTTSDVISRE